ncbi:hypothetical protein JG687_00018522 [Phytophthora cactorum]|uniref:Uncharacterized protein n=1 Tax=Phytophthora cactorum TaxID=29920 RepID=A0A8T1TMI7_9STRA|nr:hypothetical protein JG687_00018522 [Phytophthora cactorum]
MVWITRTAPEQAAKDAAEDEAAVSVVDRTYPLASVEMDALMQMYRDCRTKESAAMRTWCIGGDGDSYVHEANESKVFCPRGVTTHPCTGRILRTNRSAGDDGAEFLWPWEGLRCDAFTDPTTVTHMRILALRNSQARSERHGVTRATVSCVSCVVKQ